MSEPDNTTADLVEAASEQATVETTFTGPDEEEYPLVVLEPKLDDLRELEEAEERGDLDGMEAITELWDEYLVEPELEPGSVGLQWVAAITAGMMQAFGAGNEFIEDAMEELQIEGNPT